MADLISSQRTVPIQIYDEANGLAASITAEERLKVESDFFPGRLNALGALRVEETQIIFNRSERFNLEDGIYFSSSTVSGATIAHNSDRCTRVMAVTSTVGSKAVRQTRSYFRYVKGKAKYVMISGNLQGLVDGVRKCIGQYDTHNGTFICLDGLTPKLVIRSATSGSPVDTQIPISSWDDKLDGTGPTGITIDWAKQNLFQIDYVWLGTGDIRFGIYYEGRVHTFHTYRTSNTLTTTWSQSAVLPLRMEIENISSVVSSSLELSCYSIQTDDGKILDGSLKNASTGVTDIGVTTTETIMFGIRLNTVYRASVKPIDFQIFIPSGNSTVFYRALYNPVLTGAVWADVPQSVAQTLTSVSTFTGGFQIDSGYVAVGPTSTLTEFTSDIELGRDLSGVGDILVITARTISSNARALIALNWRDDK